LLQKQVVDHPPVFSGHKHEKCVIAGGLGPVLASAEHTFVTKYKKMNASNDLKA